MISTTVDHKRHIPNPVEGILQACTSTGFVVAGPHYPQWFAYRDLARNQFQIAGQ